jgi:hypothetical protein
VTRFSRFFFSLVALMAAWRRAEYFYDLRFRMGEAAVLRITP